MAVLKDSKLRQTRRMRRRANSRHKLLENPKSVKGRHKIPSCVVDLLLYEAHRTCCICQDQNKRVQIHHIDRNPDNNDRRNLAVLCLEHHDEAARRSGHGRGLTPGQVRIYMDKWLRMVKARRRAEGGTGTFSIGNLTHKTMMDALATHEIRKVRSSLTGASWNKRLQLLALLDPYIDFRYGHDTRTEFLDALSYLAHLTRGGIPYRVAEMISHLSSSVLPIFSLQGPAYKKPTKKDIALLRQAVNVASTMVYDAAKFLQDIRVVAAGTEVLWSVLRFAHINNLKELKKEVIGELCSLESVAKAAGFSEGKRWVEFERLDALALKGDPLPEFPDDIAAQL